MYKISDITKQTGLSADTLRYYEKIGLLPNISRNASGVRQYNDKDVSRLKFIQRAQRMNFSLQEIKQLLHMRDDPQKAKTEVRQLTNEKLEAINDQIEELTTLRNELQLLLNLCFGSKDGCPILDGMNEQKNKGK